jgi:mRNA-degrading endonuclease toxin of MazEF toxin-antitoxin module
MTIKRGQVFVLKPDQDGKERPLVIVSHDVLNGGHSVLAVPFYSQQIEKRQKQPWCAFFKAGEGGLSKDCVAKADELSLIDKLNINIAKGPIGTFDEAQLGRLMTAVKWSLAIP